ncbi:hypothetical protein JCM10908_006850 [Rhodotorula pacifica]|uniref:uncharacterized protein n=1 Tax=Rhodotorula pacifica TaxID=1495444 RepID=UPI003177DF30
MSSDQSVSKPKKAPRATTASRNRSESPPPYRSTDSTSIEDLFWQHAMNVAEHHPDDFKHQALPLARIKKVAKMDPELQNQMISSEVTVLFEKACQIFIQELTARAHMRSLASRRRMISRADVAAAVSRSDMFDFLIDIVPRPERSPSPLPAQHSAEQQQTYDQAGPSYPGGTGNGHEQGEGEPIASTSDGGALAASSTYPQRPTRSSTRSRRYSERGSDVEGTATNTGTDLNGRETYGLPPPPGADHAGPRRASSEKRQRVDLPGADQLLGAATTSTDDPSTTSAAPPTSSSNMPSLPAPPPHLHPPGPPNPSLGPQPGAPPAPILDAEELRQAYAAVAGAMPSGLFMPTLGGGDAGARGVGAGGQQIPWPPAFAFPGAAGTNGAADPISNYYAQHGLGNGQPDTHQNGHGGRGDQ